jgi:uncharacterized membrane protein (DUF485 family)
MTKARGVDAGRGDSSGDGEAVDSSHHSDVDWVAAERSPEFQELIKRKKAFVLPATIFFLSWYFGFIILAGYAPDFMGEEVLIDGVTIGYVLALTQFAMTWILGAMYLRRASRDFDPLAARAAEVALEAGRDNGSARFGRESVDRMPGDEEVPRS